MSDFKIGQRVVWTTDEYGKFSGNRITKSGEIVLITEEYIFVIDDTSVVYAVIPWRIE